MKEDSVKVVPFDKGTGFVILDKDEMISKIEDQLGEATVITKDPTNTLVNKFQKEISGLKKEGKIDLPTFYKMYPSDGVPPRLYGLVKAHKPEKNYPMRTVVSTIGTACYGTSSVLVDLIQPTLNKNEIRVRNSTSFVEEAKTWTISPSEVQVSYDVVALYPSVPIKKAIDVMVDIINNDMEDVQLRTKLSINDIRKLLQLCLSKCYFLWNDKLYSIDDTGPIGLSLMVVIAEGFLQFIEKNAIDEALALNISIKTFRRYVDDSHSRFETQDDADKFMCILNSQDSSIEYTMEKQGNNGELSFLDVTVMNNGSGTYEFNVHRKKAITNVMIKPTSSVDINMIRSVFKGFLARAKRICSENYLKDEIQFLIDMFVENGHNREMLEGIASTYEVGSRISVEDESTTDKPPTVKVPWIPVLGPKLRKIMKQRGVNTKFTSGRNLESLLCNHKTKLPSNSYAGVYRVECGCSSVYIGETKKRVSVRMKEHQSDIFHGRWGNSGASKHAETCTDEFKWEEAKTLAVENNYKKRKIRESLEIRLHRRSTVPVLNRELGNVLTNNQWDVLLGKMSPSVDVNQLTSIS